VIKSEVAYIYGIFNTKNNKVLVGSTVKGSEKRFSEHRRNLTLRKHQNKHLQSAWNLDGEEAFELKTLEICPVSDRYKCEQRWIEHYKSSNPKHGYNIVHPVRALLPAELRSEISKEIWSRPGLKERVGKKSALMWQDPAYRTYMSKALKEALKGDSFQKGHAARMAKRWADEDQHVELSERNKKRWEDSEARKEHGSKIKELWATEEYREKQRKINKERWQDPEYVAKIKAKRQAKAADPEYIRKLSEAHKKTWARKRAEKLDNP